MTYIVALTGGIGSGKTTISNSFKKIGINIIDTDVIAKNIIEYNFKVSSAIRKKFGKKILNLDKSINRIALREHVFNNKNNRIWIENLLHPKILQETKNQIKIIKSKWCLWIVPLLFEKKLEKKAHRVLLIDTPVKIQIKRLSKRDNVSFQEAKKIILLQATRAKRISMSDDIIINNNTMKILNSHVYYLNIFYTYLAQKHYKKEYFKKFKKNNLTKFY